ncbi:GNAT family N-acetyltransferase [Geomicrobium sp. JCM 19038]|uniref:GNAT family N-acetyltransferase n=1 Tax=Geomicrobium sp. JCM 19038 TaxID=1460635 RepID=UPI00045F3163|nr:GNAT family N-acetyltransferase [Geomicrobium sp. JCM 19038]GAK09450.1 acetyltransferase, GNAT family [Geomicrobium sp. JCM 19038]
MHIREVQREDAERLRTLISTVESEASFMLMEPGERNLTIEQQESMIQHFIANGHSTIVLAEYETKLIGYVIAIGGEVHRINHSLRLVIGVLQSYRGQGIGQKLFDYMDSWAKQRGVVRMELSVVTVNERAIRLYKKCGFTIEGEKRKSLRIDDVFYNEYVMSKLLHT